MKLLLVLIVLGVGLVGGEVAAQPLREEGPPGLASLPPLEPWSKLELGGGEALTLEAVWASVEAHHPKLDAAALKLAQARGAERSAAGGFDPVVSAKVGQTPLGYYDLNRVEVGVEQPTPLYGATLYGGYRRGVGRFPSYYGAYETLDGGEVHVGASLPLLQGGAIDERRAKLRQAELKVAQAECEQAAQRLALRRDAALAYWGWVAAGQRYQLAVDVLALAELRERQLEGLVAQGATPAFERVENRRALLDRRLEVAKAQRKLEAASFKLSLYLRDAEGRPLLPSPASLPAALERPASAPASADLPSLLREALERRPELSCLSALTESAEVDVEVADNTLWPRLDLDVAISRDLGEGPDRLISSLGPTVVEGTLVLKAPIPARKALGAQESAHARRDTLRLELDLARDQIAAEVQDALSGLIAAHQQRELGAESAGIAERAADAERRRFLLGATDLLKVNVLEQYAAEARGKYIDAQAEVLAQEVVLEVAVGRDGRGR